MDALLNQNRRVPNLKIVDEATEQAVVKFAFDNPAFGQVRVSNEPANKVFLFQQVVCVLFGYAISR